MKDFLTLWRPLSSPASSSSKALSSAAVRQARGPPRPSGRGPPTSCIGSAALRRRCLLTSLARIAVSVRPQGVLQARRLQELQGSLAPLLRHFVALPLQELVVLLDKVFVG